MLDAAEIAHDAVRVLERERANFLQWHDDRIRDIEGLQQKIAALDAEKNALSTSNSQISAELATVRDAAVEALDARKELAQTLAIRDQEIAHFDQQTAAIDAARQAEAATLRLLLAQKDEELGHLHQRAATAAAQTEIARGQSDAHRKQYEEAATALASHSAQLSELQNLFAASQAKAANLLEANRRLDLECAERAAALDAALASRDQIESRYQGTVADLRQQLRRAQDQLASVLSLVADLRDEIARCLAEIAHIPGFKQDLAAKQTRIDELTATLNAVETDRANRLDLIHTLSDQLATVETDRANRGLQIDLLHQHIANQQFKIERIEANLITRRLINLLRRS